MSEKNLDELRKIVLNLIKKFGHEQAIVALLMSLGNLMRHLGENVSPDKWVEIMGDPVVALCAREAHQFLLEKNKIFNN